MSGWKVCDKCGRSFPIEQLKKIGVTADKWKDPVYRCNDCIEEHGEVP